MEVKRRRLPTSTMKEPILNYWYRALHSELGVELICSNVESFRAKLYYARKEAKDPDLSQISVTISPFDRNKLWLVRKRTDETT